MLPILLIRLIKKIPRRIFVWFWAIPLVRMCVPVGISSKFGLMALLSKFTTKTVAVYKTEGRPWITTANHIALANSYFPITYKVNLLEDLFNIASIIWLVVALAVILAMMIIYFVTLGEMKDAQKLKGNIYLSDKIKTPAVYGIIKPKIVLPLEYEKKDLDYILMHEKAHIRRGDNLTRLFVLFVVCIHWFNPFAWLMLKLICSDIELACDESVLSKCDADQRREYAYALLSTAEKTNVFAATFGGSKIRIRIENILSYKKISAFAAVAFCALILAISYVLLTNAY